MKIKTVRMRLTAPTYQYANEVIELEAELEEGEDWRLVQQQLKAQILEELQGKDKADKYYQQFNRLERVVKDMEKRYQQALEEYEKLTEFCQAQGLKQHFPHFPGFNSSVPALPAEVEEF